MYNGRQSGQLSGPSVEKPPSLVFGDRLGLKLSFLTKHTVRAASGDLNPPIVILQ